MKIQSPFENFGSLVFGKSLMKERLPYPVYKKWKETVSLDNLLDRETADAIAHAMKTWALENGATHFTHWFQPLTGSTAEKHDSFVEPDENGDPLIRFSGKSLIKGEPDASSFPSGGLRATFEARGYTYWDCTSPAFIRNNVLCIPTVFVSYNGESLDKKAPLLKSIEALSEAATKIVNIFGDKDVKTVSPMVGLEQEYFLVDKKYYNKRLDLKLTGRTLFGANAPKTQELDDYYFGSIPSRVSAFMQEVNNELWKLGIYAKAEHNEAAPHQFEIAPVFQSANVAVDQNQLIMDILTKTADKHDFACLLHEKPFKDINGSGKHNNWSLVCDNGQNLFEPGDKPSENVRFLLFVCAFIKSVDMYPTLLHMAASGPGNDHRLGSNEAPPAIVSIYLGEYIENILLDLKNDTTTQINNNNDFKPIVGLSYVPKDNNDRNRTSPLAFTGNKFEFRMLGSSLSGSSLNTAINTIVAKTLNEIVVELQDLKYKQDIRERSIQLCKEILSNHNRILFSGDGYSEEWKKEAEKRGLPIINSYLYSIDSLISKESIKLFTDLNVYSEIELQARAEILKEQYFKTILIESKTLLNITKKEIIPCTIKELDSLINVNNNIVLEYIQNKVESIKNTITELNTNCDKLETLLNKGLTIESINDKCEYFHMTICPQLELIRSIIDKYEMDCSKDTYSLPTYTDMLLS